MYCPLPTLHDDLETLRTRLRQRRDAEQKPRLYLLVLIGEGRVKSRREAADYLAVHRNSIGRWLACYEREGLEGLLRVGAGGARPRNSAPCRPRRLRGYKRGCANLRGWQAMVRSSSGWPRSGVKRLPIKRSIGSCTGASRLS